MSYFRVIPRDLFNEANLLKCYGQIYICAEHEEPGLVTISSDGEAFEIHQNEADGSLTVLNITVRVNGCAVELSRPLNSRDPWPLYATLGDKTVEVFTNAGNFTDEFLELGLDY